MSIKLSCDHFENSLFSISLSPRRDVSKKRLRSSNITKTKNSNIVKEITKLQIDNKNNYNMKLQNDIIASQQNNIIKKVLNKKTISNTNAYTAKTKIIRNENILIKTTTNNESNMNVQSNSSILLPLCYSSIPKIISTNTSNNLNFKNINYQNDQNQYNSNKIFNNFASNKNLVKNEYKREKQWKVFNDHHLNNENNSVKLYNKNYNKFNNSINNNCSNINYNTDINNKDHNNIKENHIKYTITEKYKHFLKFYSLNNNIVKYCIYHIVFLIFFNQVNIVRPLNALLIVDPIILNDGSYDLDNQFRSYSNIGLTSNINSSFINVSANNNGGNNSNNNGKSIRSSNNNNDEIENVNDPIVIGSGGGGGGGGSGHYLDKLDNLERSVAAVLMKVAYGTTSTTKRSIPDNTYVPSLTTIATPPLTTLRYSEKSPHQQQLKLHHRNYELDLERDHALPTSAPNADILKSNSNPTYPNPNRHHNHDRDRHRHLINSTPAPSIHNLLNKGQPTIAMYPGDMPSYSPPARAFFTPPLPPEYQNPFADKPTLRGTNNDGGIITPGTSNNQQSYINRRPIPPPSLMPGHERIPFRPPELNPGSSASSVSSQNSNINSKQPSSELSNNNGARGVSVNGNNGGMSYSTKASDDNQQQRKKTLNTPSQKLNNKIDPTNDINNGNTDNGITSVIQLSNGGGTGTETNVNINGDRVPNISRILSGSNGKKEDIPEVLLKQVTSRPTDKFKDININGKSNNAENAGANINQSKDIRDGNLEKPVSNGGSSILDESSEENDDDDFDDIYPSGGTIFGNNKHKDIDEPKTQLTIKINGKSTENPHITSGSSASFGSNAAGGNGGGSLQNSYSTQIIHNLANDKNFIHLTTSLPSGGNSHYQAAAAAKETKKSNGATSTAQSNAAATWDIAWNIHVYLSVILFTMLGVYSIFKMIFYNKLSHLFSQSYFVWIHLILISICVARIFYLIYDAYNIHSSFPIFISELLLNLPATFLTIAFSILILFLLIRSLNHKTNRYSALIRPLTVLVGSLVHVFLCVTLHLVESYTTTQNSHLHFYYQQQQQQYRNTILNGGTNGIRNFGTHHNGIPITIPPPPPRVLSLICQIIYIFVCLSLGLLYLYIYRILKRVLRSKSQNYIHGYQNLSYAIHITIATALLFVLLAALQIFGAISISTTRTINMTTGGSEVDWLQWGYQFSLRLIEIAIIWLMSWVAGLKTGGTPGVLQREKNIGGTSSGSSHDNHHNVSGFALFPCTSSSSQEHFETDYPAVCNANTNLHTYTLRTGKPIYDDNFALNSLQNSNNSGGNNANQLGPGNGSSRLNDFHQQQSHSDFVRSYETSSLRSGRHSANHSQIDSDFLSGGNNDSATDHYENPNFELRGSKLHYSTAGASNLDNCYSEPLNLTGGGSTNNRKIPYDQSYDFQNLERPNFQSERPHSRLNEYNNSGTGLAGLNNKSKHNTSKLDRSSYENPERRSSNSTHSCANSRGGGVGGGVGGHYNSNNDANIRGYSQYNSFDRRNCGVRKSGTLNNIGSGINATNTNHIHGRNGSSSSSTSSHSHHRPSGVQTLSSSHRSSNNGSGRMNSKGNSSFYRGSNSRNSLERINALNPGGPLINGVSGTTGIIHNHTQLSQQQQQPSQHQQQQQQQQQFALPSDDEMLLIGNNQAERTNLINGHCSGNSSGNDVTGGITSSTSGGNLTDVTTNGLIGNNEINSIKQQNFLNSNNGNSNNVINGNSNGGGGGGVNGGGGSSSISGDSANSGSMLVAEHGFVRFRALDDINNAQGVGIHNASIRTTGRNKEKRYTNNT